VKKSRTTLILVFLVIWTRPVSSRAQHGPHGPENGFHTPPNAQGQIAPRLQELGKHTFPITTRQKQAQLFFNQGINLAYGFNHAEAARAFREVARLDPTSAMAYWGQALVLGPNINAPMNGEDEPKAWELIQKAISLRSHASQRERDYIDALARRYSGEPKPDRKALDRAFADAMQNLHKKYPQDLEAATIYAEALMNLRPWNYWTRDSRPYPETSEILRLLEFVLKRNPNHPGALHYHIHAVEATKNPELAETSADRLMPLMPGAGHMVHMPSHIYMRVGRYAAAAKSNEIAIQADEDYITQCRAQGIYPLTYYPHNLHFLWAAATMEGRSQVAIDTARKLAAQIPLHALKDSPFLQGFVVVPDYALTRFGKWEEILKMPAPSYESPFTIGVRHYARGIAFSATGRLEEAAKELDSLRTIAGNKEFEKLRASFSLNAAHAILRIAPEVLAGELAAKRGDFEMAIAYLNKAARYEDALIYTEPPDWHYPVRHSLGAVLMQAGRPLEAEMVYWEDLKINRENGWALFGLAQSLRAQGKNEEASAAEARFQKAWTRADVKLTSSRF
jgi:tetratricopeptide (TPR) repeat protein